MAQRYKDWLNQAENDLAWGYEIDLLVYTPDEFASLIQNPSPGFWRTAVGEMKRLSVQGSDANHQMINASA